MCLVLLYIHELQNALSPRHTCPSVPSHRQSLLLRWLSCAHSHTCRVAQSHIHTPPPSSSHFPHSHTTPHTCSRELTLTPTGPHFHILTPALICALTGLHLHRTQVLMTYTHSVHPHSTHTHSRSLMIIHTFSHTHTFAHSQVTLMHSFTVNS